MDRRVARAWKGLFRLTRMRSRRALEPFPTLRGFRFNGAYREKVILREGTTVWVRLLRPGDRTFLQAGMQQLSEQSRYLRFHTPKRELSREELRYLTEIDHVAHVALIAYRRVGVHREGVAVARFVGSPGNPTQAEAALVIADCLQRQGLGRLLLERLCAAAAERGVESFLCEVLSENRAAQELIERHFGAQRLASEGAVTTWRIQLYAPTP